MADDVEGGTEGRPPREPGLWTRIFRSHDFARDITVTTLGVLIALGIGEVVEEIRWKFRVASAEAAMRKELSLVSAIYREQLALEPCIRRRLTEVSEVLADARRKGRLPDIDNVSFPPDHGPAGDSWTIALGSEIPLHMDHDELVGVASVWVNEDVYAKNVATAREGFRELQLLEHRPGPVPDNLLSSLETTLAGVKAVSYDAWYIAKRDSEMLASNGVFPSFNPEEKWNEKEVAEQARQRFLCKPLLVDGRPYQLKGPLIRYARGLPDQPEPT